MKPTTVQSHLNEIADKYSIIKHIILMVCLDIMTVWFNIKPFFPLSERAAVDASYIDEIDGLFKEANTIENFLIQKRELLRQRLTVIANTLHR